MNVIRLVLAAAVIVSHSRILGFGKPEFGHGFTQGQVDFGKWSVYGFFVLSGILVTRSGMRLGLGRFLWHRALRLLPGLWACLFVTALVIAPLMYWKLHGSLDGFARRDGGPVDYLLSNSAIRIRQADVSSVVTDATQNGIAHDPGINGALWSLHYEVLCYLGVAVLAVTGVLARARRAVLLIALVLALLLVREAATQPFWAGPFDSSYSRLVEIPLLGHTHPAFALYLTFAFVLGAVIELYRERIPVSDALGFLSLVTLLASARFGYLFVVGIPAFAYFLVWLAIRLPAPFRRIGARNDYSYGVYIYGFVVEQALAVFGFTRWGLLPYLALSLTVAFLLAVVSWHCVERPAMRLKDLGGRRPVGRPRHRTGPHDPDGAGPTAGSAPRDTVGAAR
ncbi:acyltransferase family protein [Streptomyces sp. NPDC008265]|uniref:acyltransferase family protein n=1 Tax=Streptomyces sp. NPDC008265 TaxID=3364824 RepID=UPI0036E0F371